MTEIGSKDTFRATWSFRFMSSEDVLTTNLSIIYGIVVDNVNGGELHESVLLCDLLLMRPIRVRVLSKNRHQANTVFSIERLGILAINF